MIIYEVSYIDDKNLPLDDLDFEIRRAYFSNKVKAKSFIAKAKRKRNENSKQYGFKILKHNVENSKEDVLNFLNRRNDID